MPAALTVLAALTPMLWGCASGGPPPQERPRAPAAAAAAPAAATPTAQPGERDVRLEIVGNDAFSDGRLEAAMVDNLVDFRRGGYGRAAVDDAAFALEGFYRGQGFPRAEVDWVYAPAPTGPLEVTFHVREGPRVTIARVRFDGNSVFTDAELDALVEGPRRGILATGRRYYVAANVEGAAGAVAGAYHERGYLAVQVPPPQLTFGDDGAEVEVTYAVREGVQYTLSSVELRGALVYPEPEVRAAFRDLGGEPYVPRRGFEVKNAVVEFFRQRGHADARVELAERFDDAAGWVTLRLTVQPGPRVRVAELRVTGNERTLAGVIGGRVTLGPGDVWSSAEERESFRRLVRTGLFRKVHLALEAGEGERRSLEVQVEEAPAIELFFEPGYGSYELVRAKVGARHRNVFGTGRIAHAQLKVAVRAQDAVAGLTDPFLFGSDVVGDLSVFAGRRAEPSYTTEELGGGLTASRQWTSALHTQLGYRYARSRLTDVQVDDEDTQAARDRLDLASITFAPSWDRRDNPFLPNRGQVVRLSAEWGDAAIGSTLDFLRFRGSFAQYVPLSASTVLAVAGSAGVIIPSGGEDEIPLQERVFNGGENTVRSFRQDELGPKDDDGDPSGGEGYVVVSAELRQRVWGNLYAAVFYDAGSVTEQYEDFFDFAGFRHGVGGGLRYALPIGPVRLDAALNPSPGKDEDDWALHFSIGLAY
jgi:outer membrane protein assembly complex protein YaeT